MIVDFKCKDTQLIFNMRPSKKFPGNIQQRAKRKLDMLHAATMLEDLRSPSGNRLEPLHGDRAGQHSIRINNQWRICFNWNEGKVREVEITDYH